MPLERREFLKLASLVAAGATVSACTPVYRMLGEAFDGPMPWLAGDGLTFRALQRMTYGPTLAERQHAATIGLPSWVEEQLAPASIVDLPGELAVRPLTSLSLDAVDLAAWERDDVVAELQRGALLRRVCSRRQLYEVLVEFWTDHFNISIEKGACWFLKTIDDRQVVRRHALGNFRDLLWASAHSPAMLVYLDNQANDRSAPNENYARELLELHTLGVDGGYTQQDVMEMARCLTGWTVRDQFWKGQFVFRPEMHDDGPKRVLRKGDRALRASGSGECSRRPGGASGNGATPGAQVGPALRATRAVRRRSPRPSAPRQRSPRPAGRSCRWCG